MQQELPREVVILLILVDGAEHDLVPQGNLILLLGKALSLRFFRPFNENYSLDFSYDSYIFCSGFTGEGIGLEARADILSFISACVPAIAIRAVIVGVAQIMSCISKF